MKKIYIILTYSGTVLSKIVKIYTKDEFSHVSISLDKELDHMYSFGRKHPFNPLWAGFVQESPNSGTFKRFKKTETKIYALEISDYNYKKLKKRLKQMKLEKNQYKFNIVGLFAVAFHYKYRKDNSFYCAEFVKYLLEDSKVNIDLPDLVRPEDFKSIDGLDMIYNGKLREYNI